MPWALEDARRPIATSRRDDDTPWEVTGEKRRAAPGAAGCAVGHRLGELRYTVFSIRLRRSGRSWRAVRRRFRQGWNHRRNPSVASWSAAEADS